MVGGPADSERGLIALGFFQSQDEIDNSPVQQFGQVKVGDIKYKDVNEDSVINENDFVAMDYGNTFPSLNYAFNLGAEYKGFGINATFQGAAHQVKNLRWVDGVWGALSDNRNLSQEYSDNCFDIAGCRCCKAILIPAKKQIFMVPLMRGLISRIFATPSLGSRIRS